MAHLCISPGRPSRTPPDTHTRTRQPCSDTQRGTGGRRPTRRTTHRAAFLRPRHRRIRRCRHTQSRCLGSLGHTCTWGHSWRVRQENTRRPALLLPCFLVAVLCCAVGWLTLFPSRLRICCRGSCWRNLHTRKQATGICGRDAQDWLWGRCTKRCQVLWQWLAGLEWRHAERQRVQSETSQKRWRDGAARAHCPVPTSRAASALTVPDVRTMPANHSNTHAHTHSHLLSTARVGHPLTLSPTDECGHFGGGLYDSVDDLLAAEHRLAPPDEGHHPTHIWHRTAGAVLPTIPAIQPRRVDALTYTHTHRERERDPMMNAGFCVCVGVGVGVGVPGAARWTDECPQLELGSSLPVCVMAATDRILSTGYDAGYVGTLTQPPATHTGEWGVRWHPGVHTRHCQSCSCRRQR